jgi:hypothetical protein
LTSICKYPRTQHIEGSGMQRGDEDLEVVPFRELSGRFLVVEEKLDGANSGISFSPDGRMLLQSRGHYLAGGSRERQFELLKSWAHRRAAELRELLGERYLLYGEWLYAKHSVFYTDLPHYFMEFDLYDKTDARFLSTERRREVLKHFPFIVSVPVLHTGMLKTRDELVSFIGKSAFIRQRHLDVLRAVCEKEGVDPARVVAQTEPSGWMEGLYVKWEEGGEVRGRFKYVRASFLQTVFDSDSHWMERPTVPNQLKAGVELFA